MTTSTPTKKAQRETAGGLDAVRTAAAEAGERLPDLIQAMRDGAIESSHTIRAWPETTQRMVAVFFAGLGVGLIAAGAPRLLVGGALLPAIALAAGSMGRGAASVSRGPAGARR